MSLHPAQVLFAGEKPFPVLPAVDHYAGAEKLMMKALKLQQELGPVFDPFHERGENPATARHGPAPLGRGRRNTYKGCEQPVQLPFPAEPVAPKVKACQ